MKYAEVKELSDQELVDRIAEGKSNMTRFKFSHAVSALENPLTMKSLRKDIARLKTELNKRKASEPVVQEVNQADKEDKAVDNGDN